MGQPKRIAPPTPNKDTKKNRFMASPDALGLADRDASTASDGTHREPLGLEDSNAYARHNPQLQGRQRRGSPRGHSGDTGGRGQRFTSLVERVTWSAGRVDALLGRRR